MEKREQVSFDPNTPVKLTFAYDGGLEFTSQYDGRVRTMYSLEGDKVLYADQDLAVKINFCAPKRGDTLWVTRRVEWIKGKRNRRATSWRVSREEPGVVQVQVREDLQTFNPAGAAGMRTEETELERSLRESHEVVKERAQTNGQVKQNLECKENPAPPNSAIAAAVEGCLALDASAVERKQAQVETKASQPPTQLEHALKTVLYACKQAVAYAKEIEFQAPPFTSDDIARMAMTLVIGKEQRR